MSSWMYRFGSNLSPYFSLTVAVWGAGLSLAAMAAPVPAAATDRPAMPAISFVCFIESFPRRERDGAAGDRTSEGSRDPVIRGHYKRGGGGSPALFDTRRQDAHVPLAANPGQVSRVVPSRRA